MEDNKEKDLMLQEMDSEEVDDDTLESTAGGVTALTEQELLLNRARARTKAR
jgi:hypothetical protein